MGVSIHYRGHIDNPGRIPALCEELADIAGAMGWKWERLNDNWDDPSDAYLESDGESAVIQGRLGLKGIEILPSDKCEPLSFGFDRDGMIWSPIVRILALDGTLKQDQAWVSVKTQFSSARTHTWVVGLLRYIKKHYMSDLEVSDEGGYWETGDLDTLRERMQRIDRKIGELSDGLCSMRVGDVAGLSAEEIAARIEDLLLGNESVDGEHDSDESG